MPSRRESEYHKKHINEQSTKEQPSPVPDPFQRFEDLAHKLVNVPKEEIDEIDPLVKRRKKRYEAKKH